jgi:hypothetical protein
MIYFLKIRSFSTVGFSGVWFFDVCFMVLHVLSVVWSVGVIVLIMVPLVYIGGVFQGLFF